MTTATHKPHAVALSLLLMLAALLCAAIVNGARAQSLNIEVTQRLQDGRHVLMIRHANAPGTGDPVDFTLGDCTTQRNLDEQGRQQAHAIGNWLKSSGIDAAQVYSSQWCRCMETATLLGLGEPTPLPALNSFYELTENREPNLRALRQFLAARPSDSQLPIILITHQVTISAITGMPTASGEGVLIEIDGDERYTVRAQLDFGQ